MLPTAPTAPKPVARATRSKFTTVFINATACYLLAYLVVRLVSQATLVYMGRQAGIPGTWDVSGVHFMLADSGWRRDTVLAVYGPGPAAIGGMAVVAFLLFWKWQRHRRGLAKLLLLWLIFHATNAILGGLLADTITQSGSWFVPNWLLGAGTWPSTVLGLLFGAVQLALGSAAAIPFLLAQDSRTVLQFDHRPLLVRYTILGPWLAGSVLLAVAAIPHLGLNEVLRFGTMGLLLIPLAQGVAEESFTFKKVLPSPTRVSWVLAGLALLGLLAWRLALGGPVAVH
ncbi:hypothetical protein [Hymenobacter baengnokdamensis]|uniref:hypothetical protein n=1 Tax=Hymenobacter baengnokdamensis TaxID=2615203 RepID=UPI001247C57D|nr:hypothetical protein [Hymenobacter baengnokdamensis]